MTFKKARRRATRPNRVLVLSLSHTHACTCEGAIKCATQTRLRKCACDEVVCLHFMTAMRMQRWVTDSTSLQIMLTVSVLALKWPFPWFPGRGQLMTSSTTPSKDSFLNPTKRKGTGQSITATLPSHLLRNSSCELVLPSQHFPYCCSLSGTGEHFSMLQQ